MAPPLKVCVLYNAPLLAADHPDQASEAGVLESVAAIGESLRAAGHQIFELAADESVGVLIRQLEDLQPDVVVNLCEGFGGDSASEPHVAAVLEMLGLAYSSSPPECLALARNKAQTKRLLAGAGVPTAAFVEVLPSQAPPESPIRDWLAQGPLFVKPAREDASLGIDHQSVVSNWPELMQQVANLQRRYGSVLIERYIAGREFNVGMIELPELHVLPLAEIEFVESSEIRWPILTYSGKWDLGSAADRATPVRCPAKIDPEPSSQIIAAATDAYRLTGCRDYARVDLRVDKLGNIFVLEVNANPDLSPTAGLARMLVADGIEYSQFVERLVLTAAGRRRAEGGRQKADSRKQKAESRRQSTTLTQVMVRQLACGDREKLLEITRDCGVFRADEIEVADELIREAQRDGATGHYQVLVAETANQVVGWACYGRVPMTDATFDLYWIVVSPEAQRQRIGRRLVEVAEVRIRALGGRWILAETSSIDAYNSTREYYRRCGYRVLSEISDFYRPGDGKITFGKRLGDASTAKTSDHPAASAELD